jgi:glyoxylase-like metal-dependent hydrolase (beta-lactamase superfamily II)
MNGRPTFTLLLLAAFQASQASAGHAVDSYHRALETIETALAAHGGLEPMQAAGGATIVAEGTFDLTVRLQGRSPDERDPAPIAERISVDLANNRLAYDLSWHNYRYSRQELREIYDAAGRVLYVDKRAGSGGWMPLAAVPDAQERYKRLVPNFLLGDALRNRATLRDMGELRYAGVPVRAIGYVTAAGDHIALYVDRGNSLLRGAASVFDMELLGDAEIRWSWSEYARQADMTLPGRLQVHLADALLKDVRMRVRRGSDDAAFSPPSGVEVGEPPEELTAYEDFTPWSERPGSAREIEHGVYLVPNLRPGFHMFFVEFEDFVLAVDAPTGWYEMQQLPPYNFVRNESTSALAAKYIGIIRETVPDKPIRYVVLTHHHSDHIGGIRSFIAEGATLLAAPPAAELAIRAAGQPYTLRPDALESHGIEASIETVDRERVIADGSMAVHLIELPAGNPKADGFLVVWLPMQKIMYLTSFIYPVSEEAFPLPESVPLSLWFVRWLDRSGLDVERIYNVHGQARIQDWQLDRLREMLASGDYAIAGD